jgi:hypothetical protein
MINKKPEEDDNTSSGNDIIAVMANFKDINKALQEILATELEKKSAHVTKPHKKHQRGL